MEGVCEKCGKYDDLEAWNGVYLCKMCAIDARFQSRLQNDTNRNELTTEKSNNIEESHIINQSSNSCEYGKWMISDYIEEFAKQCNFTLSTVKNILVVLFGASCLYLANYLDVNFIVYIIVIAIIYFLKDLISELLFEIFGRVISVVLGIIFAGLVGNIFLTLDDYFSDHILLLLICDGIGIVITFFVGYGVYFFTRYALGIPVEEGNEEEREIYVANDENLNKNKTNSIDRTYLYALEDRLRKIEREIDSKQSDLFSVSSKFSCFGFGGGLDESEFDYWKSRENDLRREIDDLERDKDKIEDEIRDFNERFGL